MTSDERIAALEARVAELERQLRPPAGMTVGEMLVMIHGAIARSQPVVGATMYRGLGGLTEPQ